MVRTPCRRGRVLHPAFLLASQRGILPRSVVLGRGGDRDRARRCPSGAGLLLQSDAWTVGPAGKALRADGRSNRLHPPEPLSGAERARGIQDGPVRWGILASP